MDADYGSIFKWDNNGNFSRNPIDGVKIKGQVRSIKRLLIKGKIVYLIVRNDTSPMLITEVTKD